MVVLGPTAVGKTETLVRLFGGRGEVINADSRQVYRGLEIGTAKPDACERAALTHHLLDCRNPDEQFTAGDFVKTADNLIPAIVARNRIPIVAGGTGFYIKSFINGLPDSPPAFPEIRKELKQEIRVKGLPVMHSELEKVDPVSAGRIPPADRYRIERALEVYRGTGRALSDFRVPETRRSCYRFLILGVYREREELYRRIDARVEGMLRSGLIEEVSKLLNDGYVPSDPGLRTIGYREILDMRRNGCTTLETTKALICRNTRRYAKRQMTFFRRIPDTKWFGADEHAPIEKAVTRFSENAIGST